MCSFMSMDQHIILYFFALIKSFKNIIDILSRQTQLSFIAWIMKAKFQCASKKSIALIMDYIEDSMGSRSSYR